MLATLPLKWIVMDPSTPDRMAMGLLSVAVPILRYPLNEVVPAVSASVPMLISPNVAEILLALNTPTVVRGVENTGKAGTWLHPVTTALFAVRSGQCDVASCGFYDVSESAVALPTHRHRGVRGSYWPRRDPSSASPLIIRPQIAHAGVAVPRRG